MIRPKYLDEFINLCEQILSHKKRVIVGLSGLCGSGKSTLGKKIINTGFNNNIKAHNIAIIDDGVLRLNLHIWRPKIKLKWWYIQTTDISNFIAKFPYFIKVVIVISNDLKKLGHADIFAIYKIEEEQRLKNLIKREHGETERIEIFLNAKIEENLTFDHKIVITPK
ncbi:hypothetical protein [Campylobacter mucosalis]|uniref:hypothetical protein n=1 Tax=Campylobacter mucosalis TaxID=202 RepID=UPI0014706D16|nr:hypothetical protein [Campylobacter mucosalis]